VFLNDREASLYGGGDRRFWRERQALIVIKRGPDGSRAISRDGERSAPAPKVTPVPVS
jgi:sugar/nucleoside kinase (ribokinase family)